MSLISNGARHAAILFCAVAGAGTSVSFQAVGAPLAPLEMSEPLPPEPVMEALPSDGFSGDLAVEQLPQIDFPARPRPGSLAALVEKHASTSPANSELDCLAKAVYFEAKGEPLNGQLAVADVILNRVKSGRFAGTLCGVVKQPSQFSFVRGGGFPPIVNQAMWRQSVGVAQVAMHGLWESAAPNALFFHARRVSPNWGKLRVAAVGNHIFYR